ncbi:YtxH domain-containing protein [Shewanella sp. Scap07]|uniref:YtxH domain-containing protein n=1 Tax=Shewanella sp. Scap07 TaxID=2589987 RepID=UPI001C4AC0E4|nr:hypothetical protein [Shewanella sp. Scap07]
MSDDKEQAYNQPPNGTEPANPWGQPTPPPGYYAPPPHMMHPYYYPPVHHYGYPHGGYPHGSHPQPQHPGQPYGHPYAHPAEHASPYGPSHMPPAGMPPNMTPSDPQQGDVSDPFFEQAQAMLEGALGEEAGIFKELLGNMGMNDKEFWKGAMVGAAAALLLSNENVRKGLMNAVSGAGNMLKTGGEGVKDAAVKTASNVQQNVNTGGEIFRDTYSAGKEGFKESVDRHKQAEPQQLGNEEAETTAAEPELTTAPEAKS